MSLAPSTREHLDWRGDWLVNQLPVGMAQDLTLKRFVRLFQRLASGTFDHLDGMQHLADVTVTPEAMVRYLGAWMGLDWVDPSLDPRLQRELVRAYGANLQWRGTKKGMRQLLAMITGDEHALVEDTGGVFGYGMAPDTTPHVQMSVASLGTWATQDDLIRIVRSELPASVTFELTVGGTTLQLPEDATRP
jgi:phage tail-like protein